MLDCIFTVATSEQNLEGFWRVQSRLNCDEQAKESCISVGQDWLTVSGDGESTELAMA
jgi:hypothetical protein